MKTLSIIIPFLNEENTIISLLEVVNKLFIDNLNIEIILVNDWSRDSSKEKIESYIFNYSWKKSFKVLNFEKNKWKGFAVKEGIKKSTGDYIIIQDADLEYDPMDIPKILECMQEKKLDIVYGSRILWIKKYNNKYSNKSFLLWGMLLSFITTIFTCIKVTDEPTCYKLYNAELKKYLLFPEENGFEWEPAVTMLLLRKKKKYWEYPIHYFPRDFEHGKKIWWKDGVKWIYTLIKWRIKNIKHV
jgi:dolichol-phosphate mannosyltransferase